MITARSIHALLILLFLLPAPALEARQQALLIGISDYSDPRIPDLEGPVNDVQALRDVLIGKWQFKAADVTVLLNEQATEAAILQAMDTLHATSDAGDDIIIYFSGHGTSAGDPDLGAYLNLPDGSGAIVTSDFDTDRLSEDSLSTETMDGLLIGRYEIRPRLEKLDIGRNVLVIFDACFSGNTARDVSAIYQPAQRRQLDLRNLMRPLHKAIKPESDPFSDGNNTTRSLPERHENAFPYNNVVYFGASAENQYAVDLSSADIEAGLVSTVDGKPHGGFTDSLLRALSMPHSDSPALSFSKLFNRTVNQFNTWCKVCGHTPVSLPAVNSDSYDILDRTILSATTFMANDQGYIASNEPALQEALIVGTHLLENEQIAFNTSIRGFSNSDATGNTASPDVYFEQKNDALIAFSADGQTISTLAENTSADDILTWLAGRQWLKSRMMRDLVNERGDLQARFRHPLSGNRVTEGEFIHFNVISNSIASLVVLLLNANSELSLLYPVNERELSDKLYPMNPRRIPDTNEPPIQVTAPWGTDTLLFYSLPTDHELAASLQELAKRSSIALDDPALKAVESTLDNRSLPYSAASIRVISAPRP